MDVRTLCNQAEAGLKSLIEQHQTVLTQLKQLDGLEQGLRGQIVAAQAAVSAYKLVLGEEPIPDALPASLLPKEIANVTLTDKKPTTTEG